MRWLELKIPPVLVFLFALAGIVGLNQSEVLRGFLLPFPYFVFSVCFVCSGIMGMGGLLQFKRAKTSVHPVRLEKVSSVVSSGVFRISRNPMYLGLLLLLIGAAFLGGSVAGLLICWLFVMYMNTYQIRPEERHLEEKFGEDYLRYKSKVSRWLGHKKSA